jgi:hypothetical protein
MSRGTRKQGANKPGSAGRDRRAGAASVAAARGAHNASRWWIGAGVLVVVAFALVLVLTITHKRPAHQSAPVSIPATPITSATGSDSPPPWPAPSDARAAVGQAGLPMLAAEGTVQHIHAHLDVYVDGHPVSVPADIGIDTSRGTISPLHTHDDTGVIHIESPAQATFSLAQFFTEWQVSLSASQLGGLHTSNGAELRAYVNGQQVPGNPGALTLHAHDEIALVYGPIPTQIPNTYNFGKL